MPLRRFIILFLFLPLILLTFSQTGPSYTEATVRKDFLATDSLYRYADNISERKGVSIEQEEALNQQAQDGFKRITGIIEKNGIRADSVLFQCYFKSGIIDHYFDRRPEAQTNYLKAIRLLKSKGHTEDSLLFKPLLYCGNIYYTYNNLDSALTLYKEAETISERFHGSLSETERLYNALGALFFETGNYRQAKNYFAKAVSSLTKDTPYYKELLVNYKINLAAALNGLEEYDEAIAVYKNLLGLAVNRDDILHMMGIINLKLGALEKAVSYFKQAHYDGPLSIRLANNLALAYLNLKRQDSTRYYLNLADSLNNLYNAKRKNTDHGLSFKYRGDLAALEGDDTDAINFYQKAIIQFYKDFSDDSIFHNPDRYSGVFSYINLYYTLTAKAALFQKQYERVKDIQFLTGSLKTYRTAASLTSYVEGSYDSDEARLFLNEIKYNTHANPIDVSLLLYQLTGKKDYLEDAWFFDQRNKAAILSFNVGQSEMIRRADIPAEWRNTEKKIKQSLTRLSIKATGATQEEEITSLNTAIRDQEIELGKIQEKIKKAVYQNPAALPSDVPGAAYLQQQVMDRNSAILSYHFSEDSMVIFCIKKESFTYCKTAFDRNRHDTLDLYSKNLRSFDPEKRRDIDRLGRRVYDYLIKPVKEDIKDASELIIIPDDDLNYIPFETLVDEQGRYLVEAVPVEYQYTASLLLRSAKTNQESNKLLTLGFAPFTQKYPGLDWPPLPFSENEMENAKGKILTGTDARKDSLLFYANKYPLLHFATHAMANDEVPLQSYITFSPARDSNYRLYAGEIYDLDLDSTDLVILSACETGSGKLIRGEGMMSLTRAFSYAGCPNIIASLWKAEDKSTAYIIKQLRLYLEKGDRKIIALQKAKLDLLHNSELNPLLKSPAYWGHLVYIGEYTPAGSSRFHFYLLIPVIMVSLLLLFFIIKRKTGQGPVTV